MLTCTFGATSLRLADGPLAGRMREVNGRAAELAREAVGGERLVAGSLGPTGQLVEPYGPLTHDAAVEAYAEQARALADGGVDLLVLETFFALEEALWAIEGVQSATDLPLVASFSFDQGTRTMMGVSAGRRRRGGRAARRRRGRRELRTVPRGHGRVVGELLAAAPEFLSG